MSFAIADLTEPESPYISPWHRWSVGVDLAAGGTGAPASAAWPSANRAFFVPLYLPCPITVRRFFRLNGGTISATNADVGVYRADTGVAPTLVIAAGSTALSGTNVCQYFDVTDTYLEPGFYYLAHSCSGTANGTIFRSAPVPAIGMGIASQNTAHPLPSTASIVLAANQFVAVYGIVTRASP